MSDNDKLSAAEVLEQACHERAMGFECSPEDQLDRVIDWEQSRAFAYAYSDGRETLSQAAAYLRHYGHVVLADALLALRDGTKHPANNSEDIEPPLDEALADYVERCRVLDGTVSIDKKYGFTNGFNFAWLDAFHKGYQRGLQDMLESTLEEDQPNEQR